MIEQALVALFLLMGFAYGLVILMLVMMNKEKPNGSGEDNF